MKRELKRDSDCLDVGASEGQFLTEMSRIASRGEHVAWEPVPEFAVKLRDNFPEAHIHEAALCDRNGYGEFQVSLDDPRWSGLRARPTPSGDRYKALIVRYERLDDALPPQVSPRFIKLNVEGAEELVLRGGMETIRRHRPTIVFEHDVDVAAAVRQQRREPPRAPGRRAWLRRRWAGRSRPVRCRRAGCASSAPERGTISWRVRSDRPDRGPLERRANLRGAPERSYSRNPGAARPEG